MNNIFFKTLFKKGAKGDKGARGINYEVPANAIIGFDDDDGEGGTLPTPAGYDDATLPPYLVEKTIKANGVYDPTNDGAFGYSNVNVDVDGETITLVSKNITANGTYNPEDDNADGYSGVNVHVLNPQTVLVPKSITENGTYAPADDNADGYSSVEVNVASGGGVDGIYFDGYYNNQLLLPYYAYDYEIELSFNLPTQLYNRALTILSNDANGYYPNIRIDTSTNKWFISNGSTPITDIDATNYQGEHNIRWNRVGDRAIIFDGQQLGTNVTNYFGNVPLMLGWSYNFSMYSAFFVLNYLKITDFATGDLLADYKAGFRTLSNGYKVPCLLNEVDGTYIDLNTGRASGENNGHIMACQNPD